MEYPGKVLKQGIRDAALVTALQERLMALGYGHGLRAGVFNGAMKAAIELFQAQNVDGNSLPLSVDGAVGPSTWRAIFGSSSVDADDEDNKDVFLAEVLRVARSQIGVREDAGRPNRGPQVDEYLRRVGLDPDKANPAEGYAWCVAFAYWCFDEAAKKLGRPNPLPKTAGVLEHWRKSKGGTKMGDIAIEFGTKTLRPGTLFFMDFGKGYGHLGFVERHVGRKLFTIEGNSNAEGGREGLGVVRLSRRTVGDQKLIGYIDYGD